VRLTEREEGRGKYRQADTMGDGDNHQVTNKRLTERQKQNKESVREWNGMHDGIAKCVGPERVLLGVTLLDGVTVAVNENENENE
jgi:hypothetical protein